MQRPPDAVTPVTQCPVDEIAAKTTLSPTPCAAHSHSARGSRAYRRGAGVHTSRPHVLISTPLLWFAHPSAQTLAASHSRSRRAGESEARAHHRQRQEGTWNTHAHLTHHTANGHPRLPMGYTSRYPGHSRTSAPLHPAGRCGSLALRYKPHR
jgi:hypothetical protein